MNCLVQLIGKSSTELTGEAEKGNKILEACANLMRGASLGTHVSGDLKANILYHVLALGRVDEPSIVTMVRGLSTGRR